MAASHHTNIANAFNQPILVRVEKDRFFIDKANLTAGVSAFGISGNISGGASLRWELANHHGFTKINPCTFLSFKIQDSDEIGGGTIYISAHSKDGEVQVGDYPVGSNFSVIIKKDGQVVATKMGSIWEDIYGEDHEPKK